MSYQLTDKEKKDLKIFCLEMRANGADSVSKSFHYEYGKYQDWYMADWYGNWGGIIRHHDPNVDDIIKNIIDQEGLETIFDNADEEQGWFDVDIDCLENKIKITASHYNMVDRDRSTSVDLKRYEKTNEIFINLERENQEEGVVYFDGSGDSGDINSDIEYTNGDTQRLSNDIEDDLYRILENYWGGWEINEGSHGRFIFIRDKKELYLEFYERTEEEEDLGQVYYTQF